MASIKQVARAGGRFAYEVHWRDHGRKRQMTCRTEPQAEKEVVRIEDMLAAGKSTTQLTSRKTVAEVVEASIAASEDKNKARTVGGHRAMYRNHIGPAFGQRKITGIRAEEIEKWLAAMVKKMALGTAINIYRVFSKACRYAIRHDWLVNNPCQSIELPTKNDELQEERHFLTPVQIEALAEGLALKQPHFGLIVRLAAYTGLRAGELASLRVKDVNMLRKTVAVRRTMRRKKGGGWLYTPPKSKKSSRDVPLTPALRVELREWLAAHPWSFDPDAPLWPGSRNTGKGSVVDWSRTFDVDTFCRSYFRPLVRGSALSTAGISTALRWHDLRHTYASIMAAAGMEISKVSRWMGHSSITTTEKVYIHLFAEDYTDDMDRVGAFLGGAGQALNREGSVTALRSAVAQSAG